MGELPTPRGATYICFLIVKSMHTQKYYKFFHNSLKQNNNGKKIMSTILCYILRRMHFFLFFFFLYILHIESNIDETNNINIGLITKYIGYLNMLPRYCAHSIENIFPQFEVPFPPLLTLKAIVILGYFSLNVSSWRQSEHLHTLGYFYPINILFPENIFALL